MRSIVVTFEHPQELRTIFLARRRGRGYGCCPNRCRKHGGASTWVEREISRSSMNYLDKIKYPTFHAYDAWDAAGFKTSKSDQPQERSMPHGTFRQYYQRDFWSVTRW